MKIAFIGPKEYSGSLKLIGFEVFEVDNPEKVLDLVNELKEKKYRAIFASNDVLKEDIEGVVALPGLVKGGDSKFLKKIVKEALGKDIKI